VTASTEGGQERRPGASDEADREAQAADKSARSGQESGVGLGAGAATSFEPEEDAPSATEPPPNPERNPLLLGSPSVQR
jgi:hypothetical protein